MKKTAKILMTEFVTHDVKRFIIEKPKNYSFIPGQAVDLSINKPHWKNETRPFTFTSLNEDLVLEFTIKGYPERQCVTDQLHKLKPGDDVILGEPFGTINYKGPGVFIAAGAGITPFIAILRRLRRDNQLSGNSLIFSNKTSEDIILEKEFKDIFRGNEQNLIFTLTREKKEGYDYGRIDERFLKEKIENFSQNFYICGPDSFVKDIKKTLKNLGAKVSSIVFEK